MISSLPVKASRTLGVFFTKYTNLVIHFTKITEVSTEFSVMMTLFLGHCSYNIVWIFHFFPLMSFKFDIKQ